MSLRYKGEQIIGVLCPLLCHPTGEVGACSLTELSLNYKEEETLPTFFFDKNVLFLRISFEKNLINLRCR